jgi:hypothetical protein
MTASMIVGGHLTYYKGYSVFAGMTGAYLWFSHHLPSFRQINQRDGFLVIRVALSICPRIA